MCGKQIQEKAGISQSTASQFMAVLQRAGLVESTRIGQWTYYRRKPDPGSPRCRTFSEQAYEWPSRPPPGPDRLRTP